MAIGTTAALIASTAIGAGTALIGGKQQAKAADRAADATQYAADQSAQVQKQMFDQVWASGGNQRAIADQALQMLAGSYNIRLPSSQSQAPAQAQPQPQGQNQAQGQTGAPMNYAPRNAVTAGRPVNLQGPQPDGWGGTMPVPIQTPVRPAAGQPVATPQPVGTPQAVPSGQQPTTAQPANALSDFMASPDYNYRLQEGLRGGRNALANAGMLRSGAAVRALGDYQGNMALGELNNWRSGLGSITGMGQQAFQTGANAAGNYGNAMSAIYQNNGQNQASAYQARANAQTNALGGVSGSILWGLGKV